MDNDFEPLRFGSVVAEFRHPSAVRGRVRNLQRVPGKCSFRLTFPFAVIFIYHFLRLHLPLLLLVYLIHLTKFLSHLSSPFSSSLVISLFFSSLLSHLPHIFSLLSSLNTPKVTVGCASSATGSTNSVRTSVVALSPRTGRTACRPL
jgi:hypothetical protein